MIVAIIIRVVVAPFWNAFQKEEKQQEGPKKK